MRKPRRGIKLPAPFAAFKAAKLWIATSLGCVCMMLIPSGFHFRCSDTMFIHPQVQLNTFPALWPSHKTAFAPLIVNVQLHENYGKPFYTIRNKTILFDQFEEELTTIAKPGTTVQVRISYDPNAAWQAFIYVINLCERLRIEHIEMVTLDPAEPLSR